MSDEAKPETGNLKPEKGELLASLGTFITGLFADDSGHISSMRFMMLLSGAIILGTVGSVNVLQRVAAKASPPISGGELQGSIEVKEQRNTDFVYLSVSGFRSREATADLANLWAAEVVQFTKELQSQESREIRQFLQGQVNSTDEELRELNDRILEFSKRENLIDADKQIDAYLRSVSELDIKYETARIDLETMDFKIKGIESELRRQSPLADKLHASKAELEDLRSRYTDQNPLVIEKMDQVKTLENEIKAAENSEQTDLSSFAGTALGNTLYLDLVQCQSEKNGLEHQKEELGKLREQERAKLGEIPEKAAAFAQLAMKKQSLETARNLLFSRFREAQLFEENAPGYYRIFAPGRADQAKVKSKSLKTALYTCGLGIFLALIATAAAGGAEILDPALRTGNEAAKAFRSPMLATFPKVGCDPMLGAEVWARWIGAGGNTGQPRIVWVPSPGPEEQIFWELLFKRAAGLLPTLQVIDCGPPELPCSNEKVHIEHIDAGKFSISEAQQLGARLREACRRGDETWIRLCGPVHEPLTTIAKCGQPPLVLVRLHAETSDFWKTQGDLLAKTVGRAAGVVAAGGIPPFKQT